MGVVRHAIGSMKQKLKVVAKVESVYPVCKPSNISIHKIDANFLLLTVVFTDSIPGVTHLVSADEFI